MQGSSASLTCCDAMQVFSGDAASVRSLLDYVLHGQQCSRTGKGVISLAAVFVSSRGNRYVTR